jgi:hypothetical protein
MIRRSFTIIFVFISFIGFSQNRINKFKHSQRQGRWIIYQDSTNTQIDNIGRYRKGIPKGTWKYYDVQGHLLKKEKYFFRKIYIKQFYANGKLYKKGKAKTVITEKLIHYFYYGHWYVYDSTGTLIKKQLYKDGNKISEYTFKTPQTAGINDSLVSVILQMNAGIYKYSDSIISAEKKYGKNSKEYQRLISLSNLNAVKILNDIDKLILKFGYPGRTLVGKEYAVIFSIISTASLPYKEKYYNIIINAANAKELDWIDVAYFVDKIKVAKKEKQVYGTQYKIANNSVVYYPIDDKVNLNKRRIEAGLDEMDITKMQDTADY